MRTSMFGQKVAAVPTLTSAGFVETTGERLDRLLAYYFATEKNQSRVFRDSIVSLKHSIAQHGSEPEILVSLVDSELTNYLQRYFQYVTVNVEHRFLRTDDAGNEVEGLYELILDVIAGDEEDDQQRIYKYASIKDGILQRVITYDNFNREIGRSDFETSVIRQR